MSTITNPFQASLKILSNPREVFFTIDRQDNWSWIPFFIIMLCVLMPIYHYYQFVDYEWYKQFMADNLAGDVSPAEREMMMQPMASKPIYLFSNMFAFALGYILVNAIIAGYFNLVTRSDEENLNGFTDWYGFMWWTQLPMVIMLVPFYIMMLLASDNQVTVYALQPFSLSFWLGIDQSSEWIALIDQVRLDVVLRFYLLVVGLRQWTRLSTNKIYLIVFVPFILLQSLSVAASFWLT